MTDQPDKIYGTSHSSMGEFLTCPKKYYHIRVAKDVPKDPPGPEAVWGNDAHKALENAVRFGHPLPPQFSPYQWALDHVLAKPGIIQAEKKLACTWDLEARQMWDKDYFKNGIVDGVVLSNNSAYVYDFKTGKKKIGSNQLALMALFVFIHYPWVERVDTEFLWLKCKPASAIEKDQFARADMPRLAAQFYVEHRQLAQAYAANVWPARNSGLCKNYCPVVKCPFNGRGK